MAGILGVIFEAVRKPAGSGIGDRVEERKGPLHIVRGVQRFHHAVFEAGGMALSQPAVEELGIFFLNVRRIAQHPVA